jgi:ribonuclease VapC
VSSAEVTYVFDSSAIIAVLRQEIGSEVAAELVEYAIVSTVNYAEVVTKLVDWGYSDRIIEESLGEFDLEVVEFDINQALIAGAMRKETRSKGMSLGDRACLALAKTTGRTALTADRAWANLDVGVTIEVIR